jgi:multidrug efflux pump subunit AcrB
MLKPGASSSERILANCSINRLIGCKTRYVGTVGVIIKRSVMAMAIFLILIVTILGLFRTIPGSFLPEEDQGYFITIIQLPDGASMTRTT